MRTVEEQIEDLWKNVVKNKNRINKINSADYQYLQDLYNKHKDYGEIKDSFDEEFKQNCLDTMQMVFDRIKPELDVMSHKAANWKEFTGAQIKSQKERRGAAAEQAYDPFAIDTSKLLSGARTKMYAEMEESIEQAHAKNKREEPPVKLTQPTVVKQLSDQERFENMIKDLIKDGKFKSNKNLVSKFIAKLKGENNYSIQLTPNSDKIRVKFNKKDEIIKTSLNNIEFQAIAAGHIQRDSSLLTRSISLLERINNKLIEEMEVAPKTSVKQKSSVKSHLVAHARKISGEASNMVSSIKDSKVGKLGKAVTAAYNKNTQQEEQAKKSFKNSITKMKGKITRNIDKLSGKPGK
jgi:hypothetical protein